MDRKDWSWVQQHMPELVREIAEWRQAGLGAHVDTCWRLGVLEGKPNCFYAQEGPIALGTPFDNQSPVLKHSAQRTFKVLGFQLQLAPVETEHAA